MLLVGQTAAWAQMPVTTASPAVGPLADYVAANDDSALGARTSQLSFVATNGMTYRIAVDGFAGAEGDFVLSWELEITLDMLPVITTQPQPQTVIAGNSATFTVTATGTAPLAYQWRFKGTNIASATASAARNISRGSIHRAARFMTH